MRKSYTSTIKEAWRQSTQGKVVQRSTLWWSGLVDEVFVSSLRSSPPQAMSIIVVVGARSAFPLRCNHPCVRHSRIGRVVKMSTFCMQYAAYSLSFYYALLMLFFHHRTIVDALIHLGTNCEKKEVKLIKIYRVVYSF